MNNNSFMSNKRILSLLFFFLLIRIICSYFFGWQEIPPGSDGQHYNSYALAILNQPDWLSNPGFYGHFRPPGYPIFLAMIYSIFGVENFFAVYSIQAILNTLTVYYIFRLSSSIFGERKSYLAFFWAGFYFFYIWLTGMILRETLIQFLVLMTFYYLWMSFDSSEGSAFWKNIPLWGFITVFTLLVHIDPRFLGYLPFLAIPVLIYKRTGPGLKQYVWILTILTLLLIPWQVRSYIAYGRPVIINTRTLDLWIMPSLFKQYPADNIKNNAITVPDVKQVFPSEKERVLIKKGENPNNRSLSEIQVIKKHIYPPSTALAKRIWHLKDMWLPFRFSPDYHYSKKKGFQKAWSLKHNLTSIFFYGTLIPFFIYGIYYLFRTKHRSGWFLIFPVFLHFFLHFLIGHGRERYRIHIDAFIIILACYAMTYTYYSLKHLLVEPTSK